MYTNRGQKEVYFKDLIWSEGTRSKGGVGTSQRVQMESYFEKVEFLHVYL